MTIRKMNFEAFFTVLFLALFLSGCAGTVKNMQTVSPEKFDSTPDEGKSMVIFMRPSTLGYAIQSSVFEIIDDQPSLVGIVAAKTQVSYELEPGQHLFMVVGESADFMYADLAANKTYYALVTPRMGAWKARFSLKPIHADELGSHQFSEWAEECESVEKSADSDAWASEHRASIQAKRAKYYAKWMEKDLPERPKLLPQDGN